MQAFHINWLRWLFVMIVAGLALAYALYLGFYAPMRKDAPKHNPEELEAFPQDIKAGSLPIPGLLWWIYIGTFVFIIAYILYIWLGRVSL
jgi:hypothetical protein